MPQTLGYEQLKDILPHAYPFLLLDRVVDYTEGERLVAVKNITANEWPFIGENCQTQTFPEVLLIEAAAQAALVLYHLIKRDNHRFAQYSFGKIEAGFQAHSVLPADELRIVADATKILNVGGYSDIHIFLNEGEVFHARLFFSVKWQ